MQDLIKAHLNATLASIQLKVDKVHTMKKQVAKTYDLTVGERAFSRRGLQIQKGAGANNLKALNDLEFGMPLANNQMDLKYSQRFTPTEMSM